MRAEWSAPSLSLPQTFNKHPTPTQQRVRCSPNSGVEESPQWRKGPAAKPVLCNACGTRWRRSGALGAPIPPGGRAPGLGGAAGAKRKAAGAEGGGGAAAIAKAAKTSSSG